MATFIHTKKGFFHLQVNMLEAKFLILCVISISHFQRGLIPE